jgi:hypothetical protein
VFALVDRDGRVRARVVQDVTAKELKGEIRKLAHKDSRIITDDFNVDNGLNCEFAGGHRAVTHSADEYVNQRGDHTNTAESFFALLKRGHYGIFHKLSKKHLARYCNEFGFRWDHRKTTDGATMVEAIKGAEGKRLMCRQSIIAVAP